MIIDYPNKLDKIFDKLKINNIKPILIGGYVRDFLLNKPSNDIDIELYGVNSLEKVEKILQEFGDVNSVGRSFGVCKLSYEGLDLDFSLPRKDSKIASGHRGFEIVVDPSLDFLSATKRRDFTINAIGYDVFAKEILDPFGGVSDLQKKLLRAVDSQTFVEDPLRVLRLVQFAARLEMSVDEELFSLCKSMVKEKEFQELASERIYEEIKKLLLQSAKPSVGIKLLHGLGLYKEWIALDEVDSLAALALRCVASASPTQKESLLLYFSLLYNKETLPLLRKITTDVKLLQNIAAFIEFRDYLNAPFQDVTEYQLYFLATKVKLKLFFLFLDARTLRKYSQEIEMLCQRAKNLKILNNATPALLQGKELIKRGLQPSKEFKKILDAAYEAQMHAEFQNKEEALLWLQNYLGARE